MSNEVTNNMNLDDATVDALIAAIADRQARLAKKMAAVEALHVAMTAKLDAVPREARRLIADALLTYSKVYACTNTDGGGSIAIRNAAMMLLDYEGGAEESEKSK